MAGAYRYRYRTALVTGASSGLGESFARLLAARGVDVTLVARRAGRLDELAAKLQKAHGVRAEVLPADLTDPDQRAAVEERLRDEGFELLVNNAGYGAFGPYAELPLADQLAEVELNAVALTRLTHTALPGMLDQGHGGVLNVASMSAFAPAPGSAVYGATKAYVAALTESLHAETRASGVHVTALCPGFTHTDDSAGGLLWLRREAVVRAGLEAVAAGRSRCVPGAQYKALMPALRLAPRGLLRAASRRMWRQAAGE
ncbi:SDR family oxidoreductase [Streptomyces sp. A7024]|uniref:SDR family oxidoreductase n=1 Tax=Streptomyces coryli TaxID=1128680 RepID=A0A6G4UDE7_9ACTN|nr:SDR family oxidoreductase [Streptomyces coryli]NGN69696.1 SDR family oxidoreductase [Streptomyces coryli]